MQAPAEAGSPAVEHFKAQNAAASCQAAYNPRRNNCTILSGCGPGMFPVAQPPGCGCTCVNAAGKESKPAPAARQHGK